MLCARSSGFIYVVSYPLHLSSTDTSLSTSTVFRGPCKAMLPYLFSAKGGPRRLQCVMAYFMHSGESSNVQYARDPLVL